MLRCGGGGREDDVIAILAPRLERTLHPSLHLLPCGLVLDVAVLGIEKALHHSETGPSARPLLLCHLLDLAVICHCGGGSGDGQPAALSLGSVGSRRLQIKTNDCQCSRSVCEGASGILQMLRKERGPSSQRVVRFLSALALLRQVRCVVCPESGGWDSIPHSRAGVDPYHGRGRLLLPVARLSPLLRRNVPPESLALLRLLPQRQIRLGACPAAVCCIGRRRFGAAVAFTDCVVCPPFICAVVTSFVQHFVVSVKIVHVSRGCATTCTARPGAHHHHFGCRHTAASTAARWASKGGSHRHQRCSCTTVCLRSHWGTRAEGLSRDGGRRRRRNGGGFLTPHLELRRQVVPVLAAVPRQKRHAKPLPLLRSYTPVFDGLAAGRRHVASAAAQVRGACRRRHQHPFQRIQPAVAVGRPPQGPQLLVQPQQPQIHWLPLIWQLALQHGKHCRAEEVRVPLVHEQVQLMACVPPQLVQLRCGCHGTPLWQKAELLPVRHFLSSVGEQCPIQCPQLGARVA
mmetsp:Transcript_17790/g.53598  ORF Transcript_17790/g.53598 Transcript_17790/m.53598 type:complete len:516 (-) Transcript_17790:3897-5444(-)